MKTAAEPGTPGDRPRFTDRPVGESRIESRLELCYEETMNSERPSPWLWWGTHLAIAALTLFFFVEGISILIGSYGSDNPLVFIMLFFSSSLIIMISAVGFLYPLIRIFRRLRGEKPGEGEGLP